MAADNRQQQGKRRTDWRVLAGLGILALIAVSLLLIREEYPSAPRPTPTKLPTVAQQPPPQVAVPDAAPQSGDETSLPLEQTPTVPKAAQQPEPPESPDHKEAAANARPEAQEPPPVATPEPHALPTPTAEPSPSVELPPSSPVPEPAAQQDAAPEDIGPETAASESVAPAEKSEEPLPEAGDQQKAAAAGPDMQEDVQKQETKPQPAASPSHTRASPATVSRTVSARSLVTDAEVPAFVCRFAFDADTLTALEQQKLHDFLRTLGPDVAHLRLEGHADAIGPERYNMALSKNRAAYVAALTAAITGFDASRIQTKGWGEARPAVANISPTHRAENRRVALFVVQGQAPATLAQQELGPLRQTQEAATARPRKGEPLPMAGRAKAGQTALSRPIDADVESGMKPVPRPRAAAPGETSEPAATFVRKQAPDFSGNYQSLREQCPMHVLHFGFDSAHVPQQAASELLQALSQLPHGATVTLAAHTDSVGSQTYNLDLARRRALAVAAALVRGLDTPPSIRILLLSEDFPFCPPPPGAPVPLRCNRRVEVFVHQESAARSSHDGRGLASLRPLCSSDTLDNNFAKTAGTLHNPLALKGAGV